MFEHDLTRRHALYVLAAPLVLALPGCGAADSRGVLKVGSQRGGTKALMLSAAALAGAGYAVEWSEFPAAQNLLEAIGSGAIDVGLAGDAPFQFAYQSGSPIRAVSAQRVLPRPREAIAIVVPRQSEARTIKDLLGMRVTTTRGSIGHYLALRALAVAGLSFDAVQFIYLSPGDAKAAFSSGSVDAWSTWVPYLTSAIDDGARVIADGHDLIHGYAFEIANEQAIAAKRHTLADFLAREAKALDWAAAHRGDYAGVLAREAGSPIGIAGTMVAKNLRRVVPIDAALIADQQVVLDTFRDAGELRTVRPLDRAFQRTL